MQTLTRKQFVALLVLTLMWGVNWPMMKLSLRELQPLHFRALTMSLGMLGLMLYFRTRGVRLMPQGWSEWRSILILALPICWAGTGCPSTGCSSCHRAVRPFSALPCRCGRCCWACCSTARSSAADSWWRCWPCWPAIGLLLANELGNLAGRPLGILWMQGAAICWALGTIWTRRLPTTLPTEALIVWMMAFGAASMGLLAVALEPAQDYHFSLPVWLSLGYGVLINYGAAQVLWFGLARALPPSTSAMSVMAIPLIGIMSATVIVGEWPHWQDFAAVGCVMLAIAAVLLPRRGN